jgi:hypothetical protein
MHRIPNHESERLEAPRGGEARRCDVQVHIYIYSYHNSASFERCGDYCKVERYLHFSRITLN